MYLSPLLEVTKTPPNSFGYIMLEKPGEATVSTYIYISTVFPCAFEAAQLPVICNIVGLASRYRPSTDCRYTCTAITRGLIAIWTAYCCLGRCTAGVLVLSELGIRLQYDQYTTCTVLGGGVDSFGERNWGRL